MWARIINASLGIWLMASPSLLEFRGAAKNICVISGALAASFAIIAIWETTRGLRRVNLLIGIWLVIAPWIFGVAVNIALSTSIVGVLMGALSLVGGKITGDFGGGWAVLLKGKEMGPGGSNSVERE